MDDEVLKVTLIEEQRKPNAPSLDRLEQAAFKLMDIEKLLDECRNKLSITERELADFKQKSELERRFSELTGVPYEDKSLELEAEVKSLKTQLENLSSEKVKLRSEILSGLANVIMPIEANGCSENPQEEVYFKFRDAAKYPAITNFLKRELKFGVPPVYVALTPEGLKVVGVTDKTAALKEVIKAVEGLRARAAGEMGHYAPASLDENLTKPSYENGSSKGILSPFKKFHAAK